MICEICSNYVIRDIIANDNPYFKGEEEVTVIPNIQPYSID